MKKMLLASLVAVGLTLPALAKETTTKKTDPSAFDMSKNGPGVRKPTNEGQTKKEIADFVKEEERLMNAKQWDALTNRVDFPIYMATDDSKGIPSAKAYSREEYVAMMKPMQENCPADAKSTMKPNITLLSDTLANVVFDVSAVANGKTTNFRNAALLVKKDGQWKWKSWTEAGWGDLSKPGVGGSGDKAASSADTSTRY